MQVSIAGPVTGLGKGLHTFQAVLGKTWKTPGSVLNRTSCPRARAQPPGLLKDCNDISAVIAILGPAHM